MNNLLCSVFMIDSTRVLAVRLFTVDFVSVVHPKVGIEVR